MSKEIDNIMMVLISNGDPFEFGWLIQSLYELGFSRGDIWWSLSELMENDIIEWCNYEYLRYTPKYTREEFVERFGNSYYTEPEYKYVQYSLLIKGNFGWY